MLYLYLYALVKQMLWLNLDAVGPPPVRYDSVKRCAGATFTCCICALLRMLATYYDAM